MVNREKKKQQKDLPFRPPVVAVLGHVDHGKSTLLDYIRKSNITAKEYGGITQHIGAYQVELPDTRNPALPASGQIPETRRITFIDTPGHEAFAKLRARGAEAADIALLVVAAGDSVKPQTVESIKYIKEAGIPFMIAINKIDLSGVSVERVKKDLLKYDVVVEEEGGKIACFPISAKTGKGVFDLLEALLLLSEIKKITGDKKGQLQGIVIEARLDSRRGNMATILMKNGTLKVGDEIVTDEVKVKVRAMFDESGRRVKEAVPSKPVEVLGFKKLPVVGSLIKLKTKNEKLKTTPNQKHSFSSGQAIKKEEVKEKTKDAGILKIILKADTQGSLEAILDGLSKEVEVVSSNIGDVSENDVSFAKTTRSVIIGFNVKTSPSIKQLARDENVKLKNYQVIYKLFAEIKEVVKVLKEGPEEEILGTGRIVREFLVRKKRVAGVQVLTGRLAKGDKIRILRDNQDITIGRIKSFRQEKEEVNKVEKGQECGMGFVGEVDFKEGDVVESFKLKV